MIKRLLSFLLTIVATTTLYAGGLPEISTEENEVWYLIQFSEGGFVFDGNGNNAELKNENATGAEQQLWKFTGNETDGFKITNKKEIGRAHV